MKNIIKLLTLPIFLFLFSGCSQDVLEDINKNENDPLDVPSRLVISDVITRTAFSVLGTDLSFYSSVYVEHNVGIYNQMYNADIRSGEPTSATTYNNTWGAAYENLYNLKLVMNKITEGGAEEGNFHTLGIAQILTAYNLAILTDAFGDVPYTEALQPGVIFQPAVDRQEVLYNEIFALLNAAIANLAIETTYASLGTQDFLYGGDAASWTQFANGLKARYTARLAFRNAQWNDVITFANNSFTSAADEAKYVYDGSSTLSPFAMFFDDRDYFGASQSLNNKLEDRNDPRAEAFFIPYPGEDEIVFAQPGSPNQVQGLYGISALTYGAYTRPTYLMSFHELEFLKAEAYARLDQQANAADALESAVTAAFVKVGLSADDAQTYLDDEVTPLFEANMVQEVMIQKYLSFFEEEAFEAYNDIRRLKAMGENYITITNSLPFPLRFTYGADDVTTNPNVATLYGTGAYVYTENVWWAGGTR